MQISLGAGMNEMCDDDENYADCAWTVQSSE